MNAKMCYVVCVSKSIYPCGEALYRPVVGECPLMTSDFRTGMPQKSDMVGSSDSR